MRASMPALMFLYGNETLYRARYENLAGGSASRQTPRAVQGRIRHLGFFGR